MVGYDDKKNIIDKEKKGGNEKEGHSLNQAWKEYYGNKGEKLINKDKKDCEK